MGSPARPVLFLDVDGVISLFGIPAAGGEAPCRTHLIDGVSHFIAEGVEDRLKRLGRQFELVWSTGWEQKANEHLLGILDIPEPGFPSLDFGGRAVFGTAHWKLDAMTEYAGDRPAAWVDDNIDDACRYWALAREAPTLLVETSPGLGLTDDHVHELRAWAGVVTSAASVA